MRLTTILITTAAAVLGVALSRASREGPVPAVAPRQAPAASPALTQPPSDRSAVGTLEQVDLKAQRITVGTPAGTLGFRLQPGATIRQGSRTIRPADLPAHKGERVKVRYRESGGERRADWIVLAAPARRPPRARG